MNYVSAYVGKYYQGIQLDKIIEVEKQYDDLSIISWYRTANRVKVALKELTAKKKRSVYHVHCLYASTNTSLADKVYARPSVHESRMAICFD
jgi:hypothetical protein